MVQVINNATLGADSPELNVASSRPKEDAAVPPASTNALASAIVAQETGEEETRDGPEPSSKLEPQGLVPPHKKLEVIYEDECTLLYKKIEAEDWHEVDQFLESGYWPGSLFHDSVAPGEQARTWVTRYEYESNCLSLLPHFLSLQEPTKVISSTLPLHLAVTLKAPISTVGRLVEHYPMALQCPDEKGMLPINLAMQHGCSDEVIDYLFCAYPNCVFVMSEDGKTTKDVSKLGLEILSHETIRARIRHSYVSKAQKKSCENEAKREAQRHIQMAAGGPLCEDKNSSRDPPTAAEERIKKQLMKNREELEAKEKRKTIENEYNASKKLVADETGKILECDYEKNCTELCTKIEKKEWQGVECFLKEGYWPGNFFSDPVTPIQQVTTWITRHERQDPKKIQWSILPLHLAIILDAPVNVIGCLVEICPQSVRCGDDKGMLPLHLAMLHGTSNKVVDLLYVSYPEAIDVRAGKFHLSPLDCAMVGNDTVRARVLDTFIDSSELEATQTAANLVSNQISKLKSTIKTKEEEVNHTWNKVELIKAFDEAQNQVKRCEENNELATKLDRLSLNSFAKLDTPYKQGE